jgi:hypothetical protein
MMNGKGFLHMQLTRKLSQNQSLGICRQVFKSCHERASLGKHIAAMGETNLRKLDNDFAGVRFAFGKLAAGCPLMTPTGYVSHDAQVSSKSGPRTVQAGRAAPDPLIVGRYKGFKFSSTVIFSGIVFMRSAQPNEIAMLVPGYA